jgi:hypothetical protein
MGAVSSTLSALPILAPELFGQIAYSKNRIQNYREQDYPASGRHDREDQAASPRHRAFPPNHDWAGPPPRLRRRTPDRAAPGSAKPRDYLEDITSDGIGNESRPLNLMSALPVNSGTAKHKKTARRRSLGSADRGLNYATWNAQFLRRSLYPATPGF